MADNMKTKRGSSKKSDAREPGDVPREEIHGEPGGQISVRPWGERSFYAEDRWHNPMCFVEGGTIYRG
jgi:hypothetical protein